MSDFRQKRNWGYNLEGKRDSVVGIPIPEGWTHEDPTDDMAAQAASDVAEAARLAAEQVAADEAKKAADEAAEAAHEAELQAVKDELAANKQASDDADTQAAAERAENAAQIAELKANAEPEG